MCFCVFFTSNHTHDQFVKKKMMVIHEGESLIENHPHENDAEQDKKDKKLSSAKNWIFYFLKLKSHYFLTRKKYVERVDPKGFSKIFVFVKFGFMG